MVSRGVRLVAVLVALPSLATGIWAVTSPRTWYDDFPGIGPRLVSAIPPYNPHLATDAGAGLFATALALIIAAWWGDVAAVRIGLVGFIVGTFLAVWSGWRYILQYRGVVFSEADK